MNNPKDSYSLFYRFHGLPDWDSRMKKINIDSTKSNPFDILRNHKTEGFRSYMTRNRFKDVSRERKHLELQQQIWDNKWIKE